MALKRNKKTKSNSAAPKRKAVIKVLLRVLVGILLAVPIPFVNTAIGYFPLIAYIIVLALCYIYLRLLKNKLKFEQAGIGEGCRRGDKLQFQLIVHNESFLPAVSINALFFISDLFGEERESLYKRISLPPKSTKTFDFAISFDHVGTYSVGIKQIEASDPFGIFKDVKTNEKLQSVQVLPRIYEIDPIGLSTESAKESKRTVITVIDDGMDYCGVREYRWGDPIKSIHWKLSARMPDGEYFTRLYETSRNPGIEIFMDFDAPDYSSEQLMDVYDTVIESALSIEAWGSAQGYETSLLFENAAGVSTHCEGPLTGHYFELAQLLPKIGQSKKEGAIDLLESEAHSIYSQNNLIVCSSNISERLIGTLLSIQANRKNPILFAAKPASTDDSELEEWRSRLARLSAAGIGYFVLDTAEQLKGRD